MAIPQKSSFKKTRTTIIPDTKDGTLPFLREKKSPQPAQIPSEEVGQLALDVFQTTDQIVIIAPIAGVNGDDLSIAVTDEVLTIKGKRGLQFAASQADYFTKECFWGNFARSVILPDGVDIAGINASFKNGILTVRVPKVEKIRTRVVKITS